jgi:hypothetical protein|nr:MAG TPA: portal protein [Caudoviricetes sp.]
MGTVNDKIKNVIRNWLEIQPSVGDTITIQETNTFEGNCFRNLLWYRGDASELHQYYTQTDDLMGNAKFWAAQSTTGVNFRKIHTGLPAMIVDMLADIIVDSFNKIEVKGNNEAQTNWDEIAKENDFKETLKQAIIDTFVQCDGAFKISYDTDISKYPIIEFYSGKDVDFEYTRGRITGINFKNKYPKKDTCYTLFEKYSKDGIKYELYKNDKLMKDYNSIPETADLKEPTNTKFMMAVPMMFNKSKKYRGRGQSILEKKLDAFDSFDEVWSKWIDALRDNRTITYIPEDLIPTNENGDLLKPNTFDNRYAKVGSTTSETESSKITREKGDFDYEGMLQSYITALDLCLQGLISPSTLGIDVKKLDNADAQREKEKATQYTRGKVIDVLEKVIPKLVTICLKTYDLAQGKTAGEYEAIVDFKEYANPSFEATVETVSKARPGQNVMSIEKIVDTMYGDSLTKEEKEEEVKRLKEEAGIIEKEEPNIMNLLE